MELTFDRASKFYEPGEKVTGVFTLKDTKWADYIDPVLKAESYMDTVSEIRGKMGRPALSESDRTYFMKKTATSKENSSNPTKSRNFEFVLEATESGEKLIDVYVGVEFSIIYKVQFVGTHKSTKEKRTFDANFFVACPGAGIDVSKGRSLIPKDFVISNENLETNTAQTLPKFRFEGVIASTNCCFVEPFDGFIIKKHSEL